MTTPIITQAELDELRALAKATIAQLKRLNKPWAHEYGGLTSDADWNYIQLFVGRFGPDVADILLDLIAKQREALIATAECCDTFLMDHADRCQGCKVKARLSGDKARAALALVKPND